jgi:hypothetical protein
MQKFSTGDGDNRLIVSGLNKDTISDENKLQWMNFMTRFFRVSGNTITF